MPEEQAPINDAARRKLAETFNSLKGILERKKAEKAIQEAALNDLSVSLPYHVNEYKKYLEYFAGILAGNATLKPLIKQGERVFTNIEKWKNEILAIKEAQNEKLVSEHGEIAMMEQLLQLVGNAVNNPLAAEDLKSSIKEWEKILVKVGESEAVREKKREDEIGVLNDINSAFAELQKILSALSIMGAQVQAPQVQSATQTGRRR